MTSIAKKKTEFTGFHMAMIMLAFFGTIISVNFTMAYLASSSWSGLVVENSYVASQEFNGKAKEARRLAATGIVGNLTLTKNAIRYQLSHPQKGPIEADQVDVVFRRPVGEHQDFPLSLTETENGVFAGSHSVAKGQWIIDITSKLNGAIVYHEAVRRIVAGE